MKVTRYNNKTLIRCSDHEFDILHRAVQWMDEDLLATSGLRRSWSRRTKDGLFLRIDDDRRTDS